MIGAELERRGQKIFVWAVKRAGKILRKYPAIASGLTPDDLAAATFQKAWNAAENVDRGILKKVKNARRWPYTEVKFKTFLSRAMRSTLNSIHKKRKKALAKANLVTYEPLPDDGDTQNGFRGALAAARLSPEEEYLFAELRSVLGALLCDVKHGVAILDGKIQGLSLEQIAQQLSLSVSQVCRVLVQVKEIAERILIGGKRDECG